MPFVSCCVDSFAIAMADTAESGMELKLGLGLRLAEGPESIGTTPSSSEV